MTSIAEQCAKIAEEWVIPYDRLLETTNDRRRDAGRVQTVIAHEIAAAIRERMPNNDELDAMILHSKNLSDEINSLREQLDNAVMGERARCVNAIMNHYGFTNDEKRIAAKVIMWDSIKPAQTDDQRGIVPPGQNPDPNMPPEGYAQSSAIRREP